VLDGYPYRDRRLTIVVRLPPAGGDAGAYEVGTVHVGGRIFTGEVADAQLVSPIEIELVDRAEPAAAMHLVEATEGPDTPTLAVTALPRGAELAISNASNVKRNIYRDGVRVAAELEGNTWIDRDIDLANHSACWSVENVDVHGDVSQRSPVACLFGARGERAQTIPEPHVDSFDAEVRAQYTGEHLIQLIAANESGPVNTGVTCAVKHVTVEHLPDRATVATGHIFAPHAEGWHESSFVRARLVAGERYRIVIGDAPTALNMSTFAHFARYTGGAGGATGAVNRMDVTSLRLIAR
jgi:hypothetical protein